MEHTIYNESLVYYALRDNKTGRYVCSIDNYTDEYPELSTTYNLQDARIFSNKNVIKDIANRCSLQIRKVKVIDIGKV